MDRLPYAQFTSYFISGLKEGIRGQVRSLKALHPISRTKVMNLDRAKETKVKEKKSGWIGSRGSRLNTTFRSNPSSGSRSSNPCQAQGNDW